MLVVRYYCSYYGAFFLCEKLPLCVSCYSLVQRLCRVGGVCKAVKNDREMRLCQGDEEGEASRLEKARTIGAPLIWEVVKMMAAEVWDCCEKRELPHWSRLCIWTLQNLEASLQPSQTPLELCSFSRMLLTVLSALTERDPVWGK